ncbi:hypothetical protein HK405_005311, partial [Cladochytrium tenue]
MKSDFITALQASRPDDHKWPFVAGFTNATEVLEPRRCHVAGIFDVDVGNRIASFRHWFDGAGMVRRFEIRDGDDGGVSADGQRLPHRAHDPNQTLMPWFGSLAAPRFHINVIVSIAPELVVPDIQGLMSCAHEEYDPVTQSYINFVATPGLLYTTFPVFEEVRDSASVAADVPVDGLKFVASGSVMNGYHWDPAALSRFVVIDRQERCVLARYQFPAKFCFRTINAFDGDETGDICLDLSL